MITQDEHKKADDIKLRLATGKHHTVTLSERQWLIDLIKREDPRLPPRLYNAASAWGVNLDGITVSSKVAPHLN